ncbi:MAG TPA: MlaD family protein [Sumerlaeia bacterium]|nr:MlaD family protein [Sumerlaeia bacterium]
MSRTPNYFKIGLFVLGAVVLGIIAVVVLGAGALFRSTVEMETYIDESVQGLDIGSAVRLRGVKIGSVTEIGFVHEYYKIESDQDVRHVVIRFEVDPRAFGASPRQDVQPLLYTETKRGLRARLGSQGITGQLYVEVDYLDPERYPAMEITWAPECYYVPSAQSTITRLGESVDEILRTVENTRLDVVVQDMHALLRSLNQEIEKGGLGNVRQGAEKLIAELRETNQRLQGLLTRPEIDSLLTDACEAAATLKRVAADSEKDIDVLLSELRGACETAHGVTTEIDAFLKSEGLRKSLGQLADASENVNRLTAEDLRETMALLNATLRRLDRVIAGQQENIDSILDNVRRVSRDIQDVIGEGKQYPSHLLFGSPPTRRQSDQEEQE